MTDDESPPPNDRWSQADITPAEMLTRLTHDYFAFVKLLAEPETPDPKRDGIRQQIVDLEELRWVLVTGGDLLVVNNGSLNLYRRQTKGET